MRLSSTHSWLFGLLLFTLMIFSSCSNQKSGTAIQADMIGFWEASNSKTNYMLFYDIQEEGMTVWSDQLDGFLSLNYQVRSDSLFLNIVNPSTNNTSYSFSGIINFEGASAFKVENLNQTLSFKASTQEAFTTKTGKQWGNNE